MISKDELKRIAQGKGLSLYQIEKEYLLKLFLYYFYKRYDDSVFKGGTCLKFLFGLDRFSEDIDFYVKNIIEFKKQVKNTLKKIALVGINSAFKKEESFEDSYTCEIAFQGPLYRRDSQSLNKFRIDAGYRTGMFTKPEWNILRSEYPETSDNFLVLIMPPEEIMAEKVITMINRNKGRDIYDLWFLIKAGYNIDKKLLKDKMKHEKVKLDLDKMTSKEDYERDMKRLTRRILPYEQVKRDILRELEN